MSKKIEYTNTREIFLYKEDFSEDIWENEYLDILGLDKDTESFVMYVSSVEGYKK